MWGRAFKAEGKVPAKAQASITFLCLHRTSGISKLSDHGNHNTGDKKRKEKATDETVKLGKV